MPTFTEPVMIALIGTAGTVLVAILGLLGIIWRKVETVRAATDGMKTALVEATRGKATEVGKAQGIEEERVRAETIAPSPAPKARSTKKP